MTDVTALRKIIQKSTDLVLPQENICKYNMPYGSHLVCIGSKLIHYWFLGPFLQPFNSKCSFGIFSWIYLSIMILTWLDSFHLFLKFCHSVYPSYCLGKYTHFYTTSHPSVLLGSVRKWIDIIWRLLKSKWFSKGKGWYFIINLLYLRRNMFRC